MALSVGSSRQHLFPHKPKKDHFGTLALIEMAAHGIEHIGPHLVERVGFGENGLADRTGGVPALGGFLDHENKLFHGTIIRLGAEHATMDPSTNLPVKNCLCFSVLPGP